MNIVERGISQQRRLVLWIQLDATHEPIMALYREVDKVRFAHVGLEEIDQNVAVLTMMRSADMLAAVHTVASWDKLNEYCNSMTAQNVQERRVRRDAWRQYASHVQTEMNADYRTFSFPCISAFLRPSLYSKVLYYSSLSRQKSPAAAFPTTSSSPSVRIAPGDVTPVITRSSSEFECNCSIFCWHMKMNPFLCPTYHKSKSYGKKTFRLWTSIRVLRGQETVQRGNNHADKASLIHDSPGTGKTWVIAMAAVHSLWKSQVSCRRRRLLHPVCYTYIKSTTVLSNKTGFHLQQCGFCLCFHQKSSSKKPWTSSTIHSWKTCCRLCWSNRGRVNLTKYPDDSTSSPDPLHNSRFLLTR